LYVDQLINLLAPDRQLTIPLDALGHRVELAGLKQQLIDLLQAVHPQYARGDASGGGVPFAVLPAKRENGGGKFLDLHKRPPRVLRSLLDLRIGREFTQPDGSSVEHLANSLACVKQLGRRCRISDFTEFQGKVL
jgi:hypothetical protein